jgi:Rieske 2Fe-2S family protein
MDQAFYMDASIWERDCEAVFNRDWHLAGHVSEIPENGDYFLFELMEESIIISRGMDGEVRALANVCRHRGSRVCLEPRGNTKRFTCPYHAWVYNHDGSLFTARLAGDLDKTKLGLKVIAVEVFHGMVFVSLADDPTSFDAMRAHVGPLIAPFRLEKTKIAHRATYPVKANWKLLVENYNECYHCASAHPEFSRGHVTHMAFDRAAPLNDAMAKVANSMGIPADAVDAMADARPANSPDYAYNRYALHEGYQTGSEDGKPLAPLLGDVKGYDGGASDLYAGILNPMLIYCDHAVIFRFIPVDKDHSIQEIIWLVHEDAEEGVDYDRERLTWLWDVTTISDKLIIEKNQQGVGSKFYVPGPFVEMETYTDRFVQSYLRSLRGDD